MTRDEILKQSTPRLPQDDYEALLLQSLRRNRHAKRIIGAFDSHESYLRSILRLMEELALRDEAIEQASNHIATATGLLNNGDVELAHKPMRDALAALAAAKERQP